MEQRGFNSNIKNLEVNKEYYNNYDFITTCGLEDKDVEELKNRKPNSLTEAEEKRLEEFQKALQAKITNPEYRNNVMARLEVLKMYGKYKWTATGITGKVKGNINCKTTINVWEDKVYYSTMTDSTFTRGTLKLFPERYVITYSETLRESEEILRESTIDKIYTETVTKTKTLIFDLEDRELLCKKSNKQDNFLIDRNNLDVRLLPSEEKEDTLETKKILRNKKKLLYEHDVLLTRKSVLDKEEYFIGHNPVPKDKSLPNFVAYERVEKEAFEKAKKQGMKNILK